MKRECYSCVRRNECYTNSGIEKLEPGKLFDCGALYTTTEEADVFINVMVLAIKAVNYDTDSIVEAISKCGYDKMTVADLFE